MTPRTFWAILIKIMGVYAIMQSLIAIPQFLNTMEYFFSASPITGSALSLLNGLSYAIILIGIYVLIIRYTIFKTDWVINKLKLDTGYEDERLEFNIHRSTLLKIVVMIIGGWLLIDSLPILCVQVFSYLQGREQYGGNFTQNPASKYLIIYSIKSTIGYFMLTCSRMVVNFIEVRRRKSVVIEEKEEG